MVIVSQEVTVAEMTEVLGVTPDQALEAGTVPRGTRRRIPAKENSWELFEQADASVDMSDVIDGLGRRVTPLQPGLVELKNRGCVVKLDIVQWVTPADPVGPGFVLESAIIELLAEVGASVDVDQYVEAR